MGMSVFLYVLGVLLSCVLIIIFAKPLRLLAKIIVKSAFGGIFIILFNFVSQIFGFFIGVNALTAVTIGILGVPGFVMLLMLQLILN